MKKNIIKAIIISSIGIALLSGCTSSEAVPNNATQTGAVTGALAGSVIGYNTGSNSGRNAVIGGLLGTAVGAGLGHAIDSQNPEPVQTGGWE